MSPWEQIREWGNTHPVQRAVAGFVPGVGQALDAVDIMDPNADMRTRAGHVLTATPWGKMGRIINVLRKGPKLKGRPETPKGRGPKQIGDEFGEELDRLETTNADWAARTEAELLDEAAIRVMKKGGALLGATAAGGAAKHYLDPDDE